MGLLTFVGLVTLCALIVGFIALVEVLEKHLGKRQPKLL